jgi:hypothetical protein
VPHTKGPSARSPLPPFLASIQNSNKNSNLHFCPKSIGASNKIMCPRVDDQIFIRTFCTSQKFGGFNICHSPFHVSLTAFWSLQLIFEIFAFLLFNKIYASKLQIGRKSYFPVKSGTKHCWQLFKQKNIENKILARKRGI